MEAAGDGSPLATLAEPGWSAQVTLRKCDAAAADELRCLLRNPVKSGRPWPLPHQEALTLTRQPGHHALLPAIPPMRMASQATALASRSQTQLRDMELHSLSADMGHADESQ